MLIWITYLQQFVTLALVGLIWFVQIVHYPLFNSVKNSPSYYLRHQFKTSCLVIPLMCLELISAAALLFMIPSWLTILGAILLVIIWLSTFLLQVPCHMKLKTHYEKPLVDRLVFSNWIRTIFWSVRGFIVLALNFS